MNFAEGTVVTRFLTRVSGVARLGAARGRP